MKVYAKQVPPEYQESPLFLFNDWPEDMAICGNRDFDSHCPEVFTRVYKALQDGELCEALSDLESGAGYYSEFYKNATEAINDLLYPEKEAYSTRDIHTIKMLVAKYSTCRSCDENRVLCEALSVVTGKKWEYSTIRGCCQSDWQEVFYIADNWSQEALSTFETEYFNTGTEWIVHDGDSLPESPEDINGYFVYCTSWNEDGIANEIADSAGGRPEDVKLWAFDGYMQSPKYREVM